MIDPINIIKRALPYVEAAGWTASEHLEIGPPQERLIDDMRAAVRAEDNAFLVDLQRDLDRMRARTLADALELIVRDGCENYTLPIGACIETGRTPDAALGAERWCKPCTAWRALHGGDARRYLDGRVLKPGAVVFDAPSVTP